MREASGPPTMRDGDEAMDAHVDGKRRSLVARGGGSGVCKSGIKFELLVSQCA